MNASRLGCRGAALVLVAVTLMATPAFAAEDLSGIRSEPTQEQKVYDAVVLRPLAFGNLAAAALIYPFAYGIALVTGGTEQVQHVCWDAPLERAFRRPLGAL